MHNEKLGGILKTMISALLYGFTPSLCSITYMLGNNNTSMTFFRNLLILPVVFAVLKFRKTRMTLERKIFLKILVIANLGTLFTTLFLYSSYSYISVGMATTIHFLYPILVVIFCRIFYKEAITRDKKISIGFALAGVLLFLLSDRSDSMLGILLAFLSAVTFALYLMLLDKLELSKMDGFLLAFYCSFITALEMFLADLKFKYLIFDQSFEIYALMFAVAIMASLFGAIFLKEGVRILGSPTASFISLLEPISSIVFGALLLKESVSPLQIAGCAAIIVSILNLTGAVQGIVLKEKRKKVLR